jgi:hypothetical protein
VQPGSRSEENYANSSARSDLQAHPPENDVPAYKPLGGAEKVAIGFGLFALLCLAYAAFGHAGAYLFFPVAVAVFFLSDHLLTKHHPGYRRWAEARDAWHARDAELRRLRAQYEHFTVVASSGVDWNLPPGARFYASIAPVDLPDAALSLSVNSETGREAPIYIHDLRAFRAYENSPGYIVGNASGAFVAGVERARAGFTLELDFGPSGLVILRGSGLLPQAPVQRLRARLHA